MECIAPIEITEEQLVAYADGEADSATLDHLRRCRHCAQRARAYADDLRVLRALFYRIECPEAHTLGEYRLGLLSSSEQTAIEMHLKACSPCASELAELDHFLEEAESTPAPVLASQLKRLVARLASPPPEPAAQQQQYAFAFRGPTTAPPSLYQAEDIRLVAGLEADGDHAGRKMLLGFTTRQGKPQVSLTGARVQLNRRGMTVAVDQVDDLGNFAFSDLTSGEYELVLITDKEQVVIETIVV